MTESQDQSAERIRGAGLRVTRQRVAAFDAVKASPHTSTAMVFAAVSTVLPGTSQQAIYDCLADLTDAGLLRRFIVDGGPALYETQSHDDHHHFICRACAIVIDVDCAAGHGACLDVTAPAGFVVDTTEVTYRGLCQSCAVARPVTVAPPVVPCLPKEKSNG